MLSQALAEEVAECGVRVILIEPLTFPSELGEIVSTMPEYDHARAKVLMGFEGTGTALGDPEAAAQALLALADDPNLPLRTFVGANGVALVRPEYARRIALWEKWDHLAQLAQGIPQD